MILLLRFFLVSLIVYLIIKSFRNMVGGSEEETRKPKPEPEKKSGKSVKGVPKELGEYIDYEEVD